MTTLLKVFTVLLLVSLMILSSKTAQAGKETVIEFDEVPSEILDKAKELMPSATFSTANTELEDDGTLVYEIQGVLEDGRKVEVDIEKSGRVQEIEVEFTEDLVPGAVMNAIKEKYPGFKTTFIEASHSESKKVTGYEFEGTQNGKKLDLEVSADGRKIIEADQ